VTNLDNTGPGSFRDAVSKPNRIVVFDVSGVIPIQSPVEIQDNITIAGQSAPGEGITVFGHGISCSNHKNIIIRYMRFRASIASARGSKTLGVSSGSDMIFDHLSISWGRWDNVGFTVKSSNITLQNSIIGEAIDPQRFGALIDSSEGITVARNLWINNQARNPKGKAQMQYVNNVIYNWGSDGYGGAHSGAVYNQDLINNYFIKGPSSSDSVLSGFNGNDIIYQTGNMIDANRDGKLGGRPIVTEDFRFKMDAATPNAGPPVMKTAAYNQSSVPVSAVPAEQAFLKVLCGAGASIRRDAVDRKMIGHLLSLGSEGKIIKVEPPFDVSAKSDAVAAKDTDQDGMPDAWEQSHNLDPSNPADGSQIAAGGEFSNVEIYLNSLAREQSLPEVLIGYARTMIPGL
jgi:hypothetical protein